MNLAFEKPTNHSSAHEETEHSSELAVDGSMNTCSEALATDQAWWSVDIGRTSYIVGVVITVPFGGKTPRLYIVALM